MANPCSEDQSEKESRENVALALKEQVEEQIEEENVEAEARANEKIP
jgi:hypothetical protein